MTATTADAAQQALGEIVIELHAEAALWPDLRASLIRDQAQALDGIRVRTIRGELSATEAFAWLDAARLSLADLRYHRIFARSGAVRKLVKDRLR